MFKLNDTSLSSLSSREKKSDSSVDVKPVADGFLPLFAGVPRAGLVADRFEPRPLPTLLAGDDLAGEDLAGEERAGDDPLVEGILLGDLRARGNPPLDTEGSSCEFSSSDGGGNIAPSLHQSSVLSASFSPFPDPVSHNNRFYHDIKDKIQGHQSLYHY